MTRGQQAAAVVGANEWVTSSMVAVRIGRPVNAISRHLNDAVASRMLQRMPNPQRQWTWIYARPGTLP